MPKNDTKFKKGKSGNPNGRPKGKRSINDYLTENDINSALRVVRYHLKRNNATVALKVMEHAFGKPKQIIEGTQMPYIITAYEELSKKV